MDEIMNKYRVESILAASFQIRYTVYDSSVILLSWAADAHCGEGAETSRDKTWSCSMDRE